MSETLRVEPLENPSPEVVRHYLLEASLYEDVETQGGMTAEEARRLRLQALARIGMGNYAE